MDEPDRLLNQTGSALERALLREGQAYRGPEHLRANALTALGLASSAGLATGGFLAWLSAKTWTTKVALTLATASLLVGIPAGYFAFRRAAQPAPGLRPAEAPAPRLAAAPPIRPAGSDTPSKSSPTTAPAGASPPSATRSTGSPSSSALRAELAALDAARSTLADGDSAGALSFLNAYFRTFPRGRLHPEAEVLRIDALAKAGRMDAARKYAQDFLRRRPNSVLAARVHSIAGR
jgi:hypothetical protein